MQISKVHAQHSVDLEAQIFAGKVHNAIARAMASWQASILCGPCHEICRLQAGRRSTLACSFRNGRCSKSALPYVRSDICHQCCTCPEICTSRFTSRSPAKVIRTQTSTSKEQHQDAKAQLSLETSSDL